MPKVDVIVPAYNAARFLPAAIESVIAQTEPDWRIIIVDDGSTDDTEAVLAPFQARLGPKLIFARQTNGGPAKARNTAIHLGDAEFVALLDADDTWLPRRLELALESFRNQPDAGLSFGGVRFMNDAGEAMRDFVDGRSWPPGEMAAPLYRRRVHIPCLTATMRRSALEAVGDFDLDIRGSEDRDMWLRIGQRFGVAFVPELVALYRVAGESLSGDPSRMLIAQGKVIGKHYGEPGCGCLARQEAWARVWREQTLSYVKRGQRGQAIRMAIRAVLSMPWSAGNLKAAAGALLGR